MRRTTTLRLLIIDRSELAKNMYSLLFQDLPGYKIEFAASHDDLTDRKRRAKPHVILINGNAVEKGEEPEFFAEYSTILVASAERLDLKALARDYDTVTLVEKPFYPYDVITVINRLASVHHPLSQDLQPAPAPRRRRMRTPKGKGAA